MPIKVRTDDGFNAGLTAGTITPGEGSPSFSATPFTHKDLDNNFKSIWPVGSVYFNVGTDRNPQDIIGFGTWQAFGKKTVLVGKVDGIPPSDGIVSRQITAALPIISRNVGARGQIAAGIANSEIEITLTPDNAPFSVGQKITLSGLTTSENNNNVILNREREILSLGDANGNFRGTKLIVDYTSPSSDISDNTGVFGNGASISVSSDARATLFGTLYSNVSPYMLKGQGGEFSHNITRNEMPAHTHTADLNQDGPSGRQREGDIGYLHRPAIRAVDGGADGIKLSGRAHGGNLGRDNLNSTMRGFAHENTMPFITCYMWLRVG